LEFRERFLVGGTKNTLRMKTNFCPRCGHGYESAQCRQATGSFQVGILNHQGQRPAMLQPREEPASAGEALGKRPSNHKP
jgi:hypothetical protein